MFTGYLKQDKIHELLENIIGSQMNTDVVRVELLTTIHPGFVAQLPDQGNATQKMRADLSIMNNVPYLQDYEVPLRIWLQNAIYRLRSGFRPEVKYFEQILEEVTIRSQAMIQEAQEEPDNIGALDQEERIVHKDDMLTFDWLKGAMSVGSAVARLIVTRHEYGQIVPLQRYYGTGWLLGVQHLITNHHVINARASGEPNASDADLRIQAMTMQVQFDYELI